MKIITTFANLAALFVFITGIGTLATNKNPPEFYRYLKGIALKPFTGSYLAYSTNRDPLQLEWEALQFLKHRRQLENLALKNDQFREQNSRFLEKEKLVTRDEFYKNTIK
jgi:hypothetical protein